MNEVMNIVNEDGSRATVEVVMSFKVEETGKQYVIYKKDESQNEMDTIYTSLVVTNPDGSVTLENIEDETEWALIKQIMAKVVSESKEA